MAYFHAKAMSWPFLSFFLSFFPPLLCLYFTYNFDAVWRCTRMLPIKKKFFLGNTVGPNSDSGLKDWNHLAEVLRMGRLCEFLTLASSVTSYLLWHLLNI